MLFLQRLQTGLLRFTRVPYVRAKTVPGLDLSRPPQFEGKSSLWTKGAWWLSAAVCLMSISGGEIVWNKWTKWVPREADSEDSNKDPAAGEYVLRPTWQRFLLGAGIAGFNLGLAFALVWGRSRIIRKIYILPPHPLSSTTVPGKTTDARRLFIQTAAHWDDYGQVHRLRDCALGPSSDSSELVLDPKGMRGNFMIPLKNGVKIDGKNVEKDRAGGLLLGYWKTGKPIYLRQDHAPHWQ